MTVEDSILLHPDALHCLKRKQLVSLCRRLDIKASGKNSDLIYRLKTFAANNIHPDSPTKGNLALLRHVKRPRPSFQDLQSDDEAEEPDAGPSNSNQHNHAVSQDSDSDDDSDDEAPAAAPEPEPVPTPSLRRSPRKNKLAHHSLESSLQSPVKTRKQPHGAVPLAEPEHHPTDISKDIERMLEDIQAGGQERLASEDKTALMRKEDSEMSMSEFGSKHTNRDLVQPSSDSASTKSSVPPTDSSSSLTSSPWKAISGSLRGLKDGLQRMGSLSRGSQAKAATAGKRARDIQDVGSREDESNTGEKGETEGNDAAMPGAFDSAPVPLPEKDALSSTSPLRIIKPRPSRSRSSQANALVASPSGLYPSLSNLASGVSSASLTTAPNQVGLTSAPSISSQQFSAAAASVLAEMNARLAAAGKSTSSLSTLGRPDPSGASTTSLRDLGLSKGPASRFDTDHNRQFQKMDSIANHYAAKRTLTSSARPLQSSVTSTYGPTRVNAATSTTSLVAAASRAPAISSLPSSKRLKTDASGASTSRPLVNASTSTRSIGSTAISRSETASSLSVSAQKDLHKKRLELARQRRKSKGAVGPTASALASAKAKEKSRMERIKSGIRGILQGSPASSAAPKQPSVATGVRSVDHGSVGSQKSVATSQKSTESASKKRPVFDLKASLARKPNTSASDAGRNTTSGPNGLRTSTIADRVRTQGWTGTSATDGSVTRKTTSSVSSRTSVTQPQGEPGTSREFGRVTTNTVLSPAVRSPSTTSLVRDAQKKTVTKAAKPTVGAKRTRTEPDRVLQRKREAIAMAAVKTTMVSSSSSMDIARRRATADKFTAPAASSEGRVGTAIQSAPQQSPAKISSRAPIMRSTPGATSNENPSVVAALKRTEAMRAARLNELRARQRAANAGIGTQPGGSPQKDMPSSPVGASTVAGTNRFTLLNGSARVPPPPRSSSLRNLRRMMRSHAKQPNSPSKLGAGCASPARKSTKENDEAEVLFSAGRGQGGIRLIESSPIDIEPEPMILV